MKNKLLLIITAVALLTFPKINYGQVINLGTAADFVLFSSVGAVSNTGISQLTGNVGTNSGSSTGFGNVNGVMHDNDGASGLAAADLTLAYNQLNSTVPTFFPAPLLGNGQILNAGVYSIASPATLNLDLTLDGQANSSAVFIFQIQGAFATNAAAKVHLINGAKACNVFWKVEGMVSLAPATMMKGTIIANNAAINMSTGDTLEGRALSTAGAVTIDGTLAYTPIGCGSPILTGPLAPTLGAIDCFALFSSIGPVTNNLNPTLVTGDIGSNSTTTTGFDPLLVVGAIHGTPDGATASCSSDLLSVYNYLNTLPFDIELLYPVQFGRNLVLTPHTYRMNGSCTFTDTLYLNALGDPNAVFVIQINGAMGTSTYSKVNLINGAQAKNVFWKVEGAVSINDFSIFKGTIVANNGAINLAKGVTIDGRALTTVGAVNTASVDVTLPLGSCGSVIPSPSITTQPTPQIVCEGNSVSFMVSATGTALTYQWRKGIVNLVNGGNISGATTATLTINPASAADAATNYNVIVSGSFLPNVTSTSVSLVVNTGPVITSEPSDQMVCLGNPASFSVAASGSGLTYQWKRGLSNLINGATISGANSATLNINPVTLLDTASNYYVVITGACPPNDTSIFVSLNVGGSVIITEPTSQIVCPGSSTSFSVAASGTGLIYQWKKGLLNLINVGNISGANSATLTINPVSTLDTASNYYVVISGICPPNDTSVNVSLRLNNPIIITEPSNQSACSGSPASFSVEATGTGLTYIWRKGTVNLINGGNISGANTATLTINPVSIADVATNYNVVIVGACSPNDTSMFVSLNVGGSIITSEPSNQSVCAGSSASFSIVASGTGITYQWKKGTVNLINGGNISGATTATLTINPVSLSDAATNYNVVITGACAPNDTSMFVSLNVGGSIITSEPTNTTICAGSSASFSIVASGTSITYQWKKGTVNLINGGNISGATTATLTINPVSIADAATNYNVVITGACAPNDTSVNVTLSVTPIPVAVANSNSPVCNGNSINLTAQTVSGASYGWSGPNSYTSTTQNPVILSASLAKAGTYSLTVTNSCGSASTTTLVVVNNCGNSDLSVVKTVNNLYPIIGNAVVFTIVATNNGSNNASGVAVNDVLQSGYIYVASSVTTGAFNSSTGVWTIGNMNNGTSEILTVTVTVIADGNYVNTAIIYGNETDLNMANNVSSIETFPTDFLIPEGFSPNGDGINDDFVIRGILNFPENKLDIFNRWGNKVFDANPYKNTWDGKATKGLRVGGDELPIGTYFYILDLGDGSPVYKGTIYLNR